MPEYILTYLYGGVNILMIIFALVAAARGKEGLSFLLIMAAQVTAFFNLSRLF